MLVCPQCQFENPTSNNFCQTCGASLVEKPCPSCNTLVKWEDHQCSNCGAIVGTIRFAIVAGMLDPLTEFLDPHLRYQILDSVIGSSTSGFQLHILDRDPLNQVSLDPVPEFAKPYVTLQANFHQVVPPVLDAWEDGDRTILILEARSHLPLLTDYIRTSPLIPVLQILHWFYEMVDLWEALESMNLRQSVLKLQNLRLAEDQVICLQQLYSDPEDTPTLQNLGTIWQHLLSQLMQTQSAVLHQLLADLQMGAVNSIEDLRAHLKAIAHSLQVDSCDTEIMSDSLWSASNPSPSTPASNSDPDAEGASSQPLPSVPDPTESDGDDTPTVVLPMQLFSLDDAGQTDIGRQRNHNEDCFGIDTQIHKTQTPTGKVIHARGLYVLCDGMGGHASGEVASQLAVDTIRNYFRQHWRELEEQNQESTLPTDEVIREAIQLANKVIYTVNQDGARSGSGRMGTTLVMLVIQDTEAAVAHVGDSRLYCYTRKRGLEQMTLDHEVGQREILRGVDPEIAYGRPDAYQLTQALGPRDEYFVNPDIHFFELNQDMVLLLASDGLTDNELLELHWQTYVEPLMSSQTNLDRGVQQLIEFGNRFNGHDNITAIAVRAKVRPVLDQPR